MSTATATATTTKWGLDPTHSEVSFKVKHLVISTVTGYFKTFDASAETASDDFQGAKISFSADIASIDTNMPDRDNHLKSADFFDAETFPKMTFAGVLEGSTLKGDLTIKGTTKAVELDVEFGGIVLDPYGNTKAGFELEGKVSRKEFGLTWNYVTEAGSVVVGDQVRILANIQVVKASIMQQKPAGVTASAALPKFTIHNSHIPMATLIKGIHHITAIAGNAQNNLDFYTGILGLRMVKKTINFDAPDVYHFYFGDELGTPGTVFTTFPFDGARKGTKGTGELTYTAFSIAEAALGFWMERLAKYNIPTSTVLTRFGEKLIRFEDHDGMGIELIANNSDTRKGWTYGSIPLEMSIKGFYGATLNLRSKDLTEKLLVGLMDYRFIGEENGRYRYGTEGKPGDIVDIVLDPNGRQGIQSAGTVHHIAFRTPNTVTQLEIQDILLKNGFNVTEVRDRNYFKSIYFREPGGVLFEIATDEPGFAIDEDEAHLGEALKLPGWAEPQREGIERDCRRFTYKLKNMLDFVQRGVSLDRAENVAILLHGRGASAQSILELEKYLNLDGFSLLAPQAKGNTWYPYSFMAPDNSNEPALSNSINQLENLVSGLYSQGFEPAQIFWIGFSQGACLSLEIASRHAKKYGGVIAFTGGLIGEKLQPERYSGDFQGTPVFIGASFKDMHVPLERIEASAKLMESMGANVKTMIFQDTMHTIRQEELEWVNKNI